MNTVCLVMHQSRPDVKALTREIVRAFQFADMKVTCEDWLWKLMGEESEKLFEKEAVFCDAIVAVGGDGTLLRANQLAIGKNIPLIGINMGRIGFLAEVEMVQLPEACQKLKRGEYYLENRMMLEANLGGEVSSLALNDVVVSRGGYARLIAVKAWVDNKLVGRYIADGLIVSTPTGSTGYSLSAGGPIVFPGVECVVISPICAHSLQHRPVVISAQQTVMLELDGGPLEKAQISIDGLEPAFLSAKQKITITCAEKRAQFIRFDHKDFFQIIRQKLSEWSC